MQFANGGNIIIIIIIITSKENSTCYSVLTKTNKNNSLNFVTDDPGSKPDQKYARRRDTQNYIRKYIV